MQTPQLFKLLLSPRNWLPALGLGVLWLLNQLPYALKIRLGLSFGGVLYWMLRNRRGVAATNLRLCFPDKSEADRYLILRNAYRHLGAGLIEMAMSWWTPGEQIQALTETEGLQHLRNAWAQNRGLIMIGAHFSCLDIGAKMINSQQPFHVVQRSQKNPLFNYVMHAGRTSGALSVIDNRDVRGIVRTVRQGDAIWFAPDHDMGSRGSVFAPFFAQRAATITAPVKFMRLTGAPAVFCATHRKPDNSGYVLRISPIPADIVDDDDITAATRLNRIIADNIEIDASQYYWFHRRFKTQPQLDKGALYKS